MSILILSKFWYYCYKWHLNKQMCKVYGVFFWRNESICLKLSVIKLLIWIMKWLTELVWLILHLFFYWTLTLTNDTSCKNNKKNFFISSEKTKKSLGNLNPNQNC